MMDKKVKTVVVVLVLSAMLSLGAMADSKAGEKAAKRILNLDRPLVIGHRGYPDFFPENTIPSFKAAAHAGADLVELDYYVSEDGVQVVFHDKTLDRTTDAVKAWGEEGLGVKDKSYQALSQLDVGSWFDPKFSGLKMPTVEETLDVIHENGSVTLIERKEGSAADLVELLEKKNLINEVFVQSFDWEYLKDIRKLNSEQILGALGPPRKWEGRKLSRDERELSPKWVDYIKDCDVQVIGWNRYVNPEAIAYAHEEGLEVWVYTINKLDKIQELLEMGVDGIITNNTSMAWKGMELLDK